MIEFQLNLSDFSVILPEIVLAVGGMLMLFMEIYLKDRALIHQWTAFAFFAVAFYIVIGMGGAALDGFGGMVRSDLFSQFIAGTVLIGGALTVVLGKEYLVNREWHRGEYYSLLLFASVGMLFMAKGIDLIIIFLGLELLSISLYILVGFFRERLFSNEAALKYLLLGAFSSGFLLYGIAFIYGSYGTTNLIEIRAAGLPSALPFLWVGMSLLLVGIGFKLAIVPFHMWSPDVYQGAPTPITGFMATTTKAAAFAAMLRLVIYAFPLDEIDWTPVFWILTMLTMTVGNVLAIQQNNLKRMLAYSSIAHAGYIMVGITTASVSAAGGTLFYLLGYLFMNIGAFTVVQLIEGKGETRLEFEDYSGMAKRNPVIALTMSLFMFALAGFPLTAGFTGKFYLFNSAVNEGFIWLIIIAVLNSLASVYYYLRVIIFMYMKEGERDAEPAVVSQSVRLALGVCAFGLVYLGVMPGQFIEIAKNAATTLF